jgi:hypothetical protein
MPRRPRRASDLRRALARQAEPALRLPNYEERRESTRPCTVTLLGRPLAGAAVQLKSPLPPAVSLETAPPERDRRGTSLPLESRVAGSRCQIRRRGRFGRTRRVMWEATGPLGAPARPAPPSCGSRGGHAEPPLMRPPAAAPAGRVRRATGMAGGPVLSGDSEGSAWAPQAPLMRPGGPPPFS